MDLLPEEKLIWSPIVANSSMNRKRVASGINSYEKEFGFKPEAYLDEKIKRHGHASWVDICCGEGNALLQTANYFDGKGFQDKVQLIGIDLLDAFQPIDSKINCLVFETLSVINWLAAQKYDLITCSHGLHYLGDKLKVIETMVGALNPGGLFIANFDIKSISIAGIDTVAHLKNYFKKFQIAYDARKKIIKKLGPVTMEFKLSYIGADDKAGPNYTGQDAVTSYYTEIK